MIPLTALDSAPIWPVQEGEEGVDSRMFPPFSFRTLCWVDLDTLPVLQDTMLVRCLDDIVRRLGEVPWMLMGPLSFPKYHQQFVEKY